MRNPEETPVAACAACGAQNVTLHSVGESQLCGDCSFRCRDCLEWYASDSSNDTESGAVCTNCRESYTTCTRCDRVVPDEEAHTVSGDPWCERCRDRRASFCQRCEELFDPNQETMQTLHDRDGDYCEACQSDVGAFYCDGCDYSYSLDSYGGRRHGHIYCQGCYEGDEEEEEEEPPPPPPDEAIQDYHSHKRRWNRFGRARRGVYYGVELEAISEKDRWDFPEVAKKLEAEFGILEDNGERKEFLFTEFDGSLREDPEDRNSRQRGFETIIHPMAPEWIAQNKDVLAKVLSLLVAGKMVSYRSVDQNISAGMHVTLSWDGLSKATKLKFLRLIYDNPTLSSIVSRRRPESLERYSKVRAPAKPLAMVLRKEGYEQKHFAVHLKVYTDRRTGGYIDLAEVRLFRGTLKIDSFLMNIEYVLACVDFAVSYHYGIQETSAENLLAFIDKNRKSYPNIQRWLKQKGLIK